MNNNHRQEKRKRAFRRCDEFRASRICGYLWKKARRQDLSDQRILPKKHGI